MRGLFGVACHTAIIFIILFSHRVAGQQGAIPYGLSYDVYNSIPPLTFQVIDTASLTEQRDASQRTASETVAYNFKTHFVPGKDGNWKTIFPGVDSWFLKLRSDGAYGLAVVFSGVDLMAGETLYVYNQQGLHRAYTNHTIPRSGILPLDFLRGDEIMIEYDVVAGRKNHGTFVVETVSHAYRNIFDTDVHHVRKESGRYSDDCYLCFEDDAIAKERRAVVKLVIQYEFSAKVCTGTLINNATDDKTPYILTAEHCVSNQTDANRTVFIFGYEDENCVKLTGSEIMLNGAYYRASVFENDFSLLELYDKPPLESHPYYAGWDISDQSLAEVTCIHHAEGGPKKVSVSNGTVKTSTLDDGQPRTPNAFWNVLQWDVGATEGGSSGAALFNKQGQVIGTLSGGSSQCGAPYNDYFAKLSTSWEASSDPGNQLKFWLDPAGTGVQTLRGMDPFEGIHVVCNTVSNVGPGEHQTLLPFTSGQGYFSGYNSNSIATYAERFSATDNAKLTGVKLNVGSVNVESPGGLLVSVHGSDDGIPGPALGDIFIPYHRLVKDTLNYVGFYPYVELAGDFFISYTLSYSLEDSFALKQVDWRSNATNTAFVKLTSGWVPMSTISPGGAGSSLSIEVALCENTLAPTTPETRVEFYPNPATDVLVGKFPDDIGEDFDLQVYDLQGKKQNVTYTKYENTVVIATADLCAGMYIVRLSTSHASYPAKFVKLN